LKFILASIPHPVIWQQCRAELHNDNYYIPIECSLTHETVGQAHDTMGQTHDTVGQTHDTVGQTQDTVGQTHHTVGQTHDNVGQPMYYKWFYSSLCLGDHSRLTIERLYYLCWLQSYSLILYSTWWKLFESIFRNH
jgi:hypothetical protein